MRARRADPCMLKGSTGSSTGSNDDTTLTVPTTTAISKTTACMARGCAVARLPAVQQPTNPGPPGGVWVHQPQHHATSLLPAFLGSQQITCSPTKVHTRTAATDDGIHGSSIGSNGNIRITTARITIIVVIHTSSKAESGRGSLCNRGLGAKLNQPSPPPVAEGWNQQKEAWTIEAGGNQRVDRGQGHGTNANRGLAVYSRGPNKLQVAANSTTRWLVEVVHARKHTTITSTNTRMHMTTHKQTHDAVI